MVQRCVCAWAWNLLPKTILIKRTSDFHSHRKNNSSVAPSFYCNHAEAERTRIWTLCSLYLILATVRCWQGLPDCSGAQRGRQHEQGSCNRVLGALTWAGWTSPRSWGNSTTVQDAAGSTHPSVSSDLPKRAWDGSLILDLRWHCCRYCINRGH